MGWLITFAVIILLLILPLGVSLLYNADGLLLYVCLSSLRIKIYPFKRKEKKNKTKEKKPQKRTQAGKKSRQSKPTGSITDFMPLVKTLFDFLRDFKTRLRVNRLDLKVVLAGGDPSNLAVNYGRTWIAIGNLMPLLERFLIIKKRNVDVCCDFNADETFIIARVDISITISRLLSLGIYYGIRILREYMNILNQRKGGARI